MHAKLLALSALAALTAAVPLEGRGYLDGAPPAPAANNDQKIIWHTVTEWEVKTVDVYTTIWVNAPGAGAKTVTDHKVVATSTKTAAPTPPVVAAAPKQHKHHGGAHHGRPKHHHSKHKPAPVPAPAPTPKPAPSPAPSPPQIPPQANNAYVAPQSPPPAPAPKPPKVEAPPKKVAPPPAPAPKPTPKPAPAPKPKPAPAPVQQQPKPQPTPEKTTPAPAKSAGGGSDTGASLFQGYTGSLPGATHPFACKGGCKGDITHFNPSDGVGACGYPVSEANDNSDVVAVAVAMMGSLSSGDVMNPFCGKYVTITNPKNGKTAKGKVTDKCPGCMGNEDIDLSPALFEKLGALGDGRIGGVKWEWAS